MEKSEQRERARLFSDRVSNCYGTDGPTPTSTVHTRDRLRMEYARLDHCRYEGKWYQRCRNWWTPKRPHLRISSWLGPHAGFRLHAHDSDRVSNCSVTVTVTNLSQASLGRPSPRALKPRLRYKLNHGVVGGVYYNLYTRGARPGRVVCLRCSCEYVGWALARLAPPSGRAASRAWSRVARRVGGR